MAKSLFVILVSFGISTSVTFGENACSHYEDKDCVHPNILKNGYFINQWSVCLPGMTKDQARQLLEENGFDYLGKIMDGVDLHLVTKKGTQEKHAMPNDRIIELLKKHEKVHSVAQKHVLGNSPDVVFNIVDEDEVRCESLDPNTIVLNDGWNNLERITEFEAAEAAAAAAAAEATAEAAEATVQAAAAEATAETAAAEATATASDDVKPAGDADGTTKADDDGDRKVIKRVNASAEDISRSAESSDSEETDSASEESFSEESLVANLSDEE